MKLVLEKCKHGLPSERFKRFIMPVTESGCHLWIGACGASGYGHFSIRANKYQYAHRMAYELIYGPIPESMEIDHLCRVRCCVNPDHLEAVTKKENSHRSESFAGKNSRKTHCPLGHPYAGNNLHVYPNGYRRCKVCHAETFARFKRNHPTYMRDYQREAVKRLNGQWEERSIT